MAARILTVICMLLALFSVFCSIALGLKNSHSRQFLTHVGFSLGLHAVGVVMAFAAYIVVADHHYKMWLVIIGLLGFALFSSILECLISAAAADGDLNSFTFQLVQGLLEGLAGLVYLCYALLSRPRSRPTLYHVLITWPACTQYTAVFLSSLLLPLTIWLPEKHWALGPLLLPHCFAVMGLFQSLNDTAWEEISLSAMPKQTTKNTKARRGRPAQRFPLPLDTNCADSFSSLSTSTTSRPLRIVQLTDVHLGGFMSVHHLQQLCHTVADTIRPDLVLLTGDFHTPETDYDPLVLKTALAPLEKMKGRTFACLGNHDKETVGMQADIIQHLEALQICVLIDADTKVDIPEVGLVHIVGADFRRKGLQDAMSSLCLKCPVPPDATHSLLLLHDPRAFRYIPPERGCIVFSGHTHGGHVGLLSCGINLTLIGLAGGFDHGLWHQGQNTLYVHRGQGFRSLSCNFILRVGVRNELSVLSIPSTRLQHLSHS